MKTAYYIGIALIVIFIVRTIVWLIKDFKNGGTGKRYHASFFSVSS